MCYICGNLIYVDKIKKTFQKPINFLEFLFQDIYDQYLKTIVIKSLILIWVGFLEVRFEVAGKGDKITSPSV